MNSETQESTTPSPETAVAEARLQKILDETRASDSKRSEFDYIIVGSGAGGGPLAARLAERGKKVLVIEAGHDPIAAKSDAYPNAEPGEVTKIPGYHGAATEDAELSWMFSVRHYWDTARQNKDHKYNKNIDPNTGGKIPDKFQDRYPKGGKQGIFYPRASGIGGCTAHHAMITIAPNDKDWNDIADLTGDDSWRADHMRGYFARFERNQYIDAYDSALNKLLGWFYEIWRRVVLFVDPRAVLDRGGHGFKGWAPTNFIDPFLIFRIAKTDMRFFQVIARAALAVLHGNNRFIATINQVLRFQTVPAIDFNDINTRRANPEGVFLIPIGTESGDGTDDEGQPSVGRRFGVREFLLSTQRKYPNRLIIRDHAHVTRILFEKGEKAPRAIGVECAIGDHLYEASPKQNLNPSKERVTYFVKKEVGEVILCGGAFNTPQLLMLSGIGDEVHLGKTAELAKGDSKFLDALSENERALAQRGKLCTLRDHEGKPLSESDAALPLRIHLPGVGGNLQDRYEVTVVSELKDEFVTLDGVFFKPGEKADRARKEWIDKRTGLYATNGGTLAVIRRSKPVVDAGGVEPDLFTFGAPAAFRGYYWNYSHELFRRTIGAPQESHKLWSWVILKAYTRNHDGTVHLRNADPFSMPEVCFDAFNEKAERDRIKLEAKWRDVTSRWEECVRLHQALPADLIEEREKLIAAREENAGKLADSKRDLAALVDAVAFMRKVNRHINGEDEGDKKVCDDKKTFADEIQPGDEIKDYSSDMEEWVKTQAWGHHASCTCRIGSDEWQANRANLRDKNAVLDSHFRVHGVERLRVVDASVFPKIPGYFILAPIFMISEKAADTLIEDAATTVYPKEFRAAEAAAIRERRKKASSSHAEKPTDPGLAPAKNITVQGNTPPSGTVGLAVSGAGQPIDNRVAACDSALPSNRVGLALSGGGIRSATFALGVLQALAHKDRIRDVDILSTVSGGGFTGSFVGRLFTRSAVNQSDDPVGRVQNILKDSRSAPLQWLRTNANYLFVGGSADLQMNLAIFWRNIFTIYLVVGTLLFAVFGLLAWLPRVVSWLFDYFGWFRLRAMLAPFFVSPPFRGITLSPWWWLPIIVLAMAVLPMTLGYWLAPRPGSYRPYPFFALLAWLIALAGAIISLLLPYGLRYTVGALVVLGLAWLWQELARGGALARSATEPERLQVGSVIRNRLARSLGSTVTIFVGLFLWVVLDTLALLFARRPVGVAIMSIVVALGPVLPLLRWLAMYGLRCLSSGDKKGFSLIRIATLLGIPLGVLLVWAIDVLAHRLFVVAPGNAGWVILLTALFSVALGRAVEFLNLSSLRDTYAARLRRTFQGASNPDRIYGQTDNISRDVQLAHPEDDLSYDRYHPEKHGGPLHLINVCVNETVDFASERTVRERKGLPMCITPHGVSVGLRYFAEWIAPDELPKWQKRRRWRDGLDAEDRKAFEERRKTALKALQVSSDPNAFHVLKRTGSESAEVESLSLGDWVSISGAAYSTGIGRATNLPLALCLGLLNIRLGYWWDSGILPQERPGRYPPNFWRRLKRYPSKLLTMQSMLLAEWTASFRGPSEWFWNLSDGGHFEVTGMYELLRRRVPFIILSDAGEDPKYRWGDVALLMQEAREDFGAEITWLDLKTARSLADENEKKRRAALTSHQRQQEDAAESAKSENDRIAARWHRVFRALPVGVEAPAKSIQSWIQLNALGALDNIRDRESPYHAALAQVTYDGKTTPDSWILLLKPSLSKELTEDIVNYGKEHPDFPQQSTFDQVFDDIQWESYRALGEQIGCKVIQPA